MAQPEARKLYPPVEIHDSNGFVVTFTFTNGLSSELNVTNTKDYTRDAKSQPSGFFIKPLVSGVIKVQLMDQEDGESYTFSSEEVDAFIGTELNARIKKIFKDTTTVTRIKVVW